ncbi:Spore coat protein CotF [Anaerovirgula multivorans]|uniref:Spore coat protein CotF n=1 Tax=Anaerovirgula multivorans TaxID=312168 RepID=A0A239BX35_9FIRM|nr:spore coat protein [Anaerovirgula multivorans]SNS12209.1 Spore coat protein CotF [Anaerovirgula multivorans]
MNIQLTQKETMLLQDQKSHEEMCIKKYNNYANQAQDPQLKQLFKFHASQEQQHLDTINQLLNGQLPNTNQQQNQQQNQMQSNVNSNDSDLCQDLLMTEKYVSGTYNTVIFEFTNTNARQVLNHIQKEEQQHGEDIFNYMQQNGMYQVQ